MFVDVLPFYRIFTLTILTIDGKGSYLSISAMSIPIGFSILKQKVYA